jgi:hypothetical protein
MRGAVYTRKRGTPDAPWNDLIAAKDSSSAGLNHDL